MITWNLRDQDGDVSKPDQGPEGALADEELEDGLGEDEDEEDEKKGGCLAKGCFSAIIAIFIIILLLLFWPVNKPQGSRSGPDLTYSPKNVRKGRGYIGRSYWRVLSVQKTLSPINGVQPTSKGAFVVVKFSVRNLASDSRSLDQSMVSLIDGGGRQYPLSERTTGGYYEAIDQEVPWNELVKPRKSVEVYAAFNVAKPADFFKLEVRDFDWRSTDTIRVVAGKAEMISGISAPR